MTTNGQLRGSLLTMQVALNRVQQAVFDGDDTPNNLDNQQWWRNATQAINAAQDAVPSDSEYPSKVSVDAFNDAKVKYDTFVSTYGEFGSDAWPSFPQAVIDAARVVPETIGNAVGGAIGGVTDELGKGVKSLFGSFFGSLGVWGWLLLIVGGLALLTYIYPQWTLAVRGLFFK